MRLRLGPQTKAAHASLASASGDEITRDVAERINPAFHASGQCTGPVGVVFASCSTASVIRRQVAAPSRSPSVSRQSARVALSLGALSPKRLSIRSATRQMSISGVTGRNSECAIRKRLANAGDARERVFCVKCHRS